MRKYLLFTLFLIFFSFSIFLSLEDRCDEDVSVAGYIKTDHCAREFRRRAEAGDVSAMAIYAEYATANGDRKNAYHWTAEAARNGNLRGLGTAISFCGEKNEEFSAKKVEGWIRLAIPLYKSKDDLGTALLINFYLGEGGCEKDLFRAASVIGEYSGSDCRPVIRFLEEIFDSKSTFTMDVKKSTTRALARCRVRGKGDPVNLPTAEERDRLLKILIEER